MGSQNIPVPAETLRRLTEGATHEITEARESGRKATARRLQRQVAEALETTQYEDGEFVSVDAGLVSSLVAAGGHRDSGRDYAAGAKVYLEMYGVW